MGAAANTAGKFDAVASALGSTTESCDQLKTLLVDLLRALFGTVGLGPVDVYDTGLLSHVDDTISHYPTLNSRAASCGISGLPPLSTVLTNLKAIKKQIIDNHTDKLPEF